MVYKNIYIGTKFVFFFKIDILSLWFSILFSVYYPSSFTCYVVGLAIVLWLALSLLSSFYPLISGRLKTSLEGSLWGWDGGIMSMKMAKAIGYLNLTRYRYTKNFTVHPLAFDGHLFVIIIKVFFTWNFRSFTHYFNGTHQGSCLNLITFCF